MDRRACGPGDVVVTGDIPLAAKCVAAGARVVKHNGEELTAANVGMALATRDLMADLRAGRSVPAGRREMFSKADRSRFLDVLDRGAASAAERRELPAPRHVAGRTDAARAPGSSAGMARSPALTGILFAIGGTLIFSVNDVSIKFLSGGYALHQVILIRAFVAMTFILTVIHVRAGLFADRHQPPQHASGAGAAS